MSLATTIAAIFEGPRAARIHSPTRAAGSVAAAPVRCRQGDKKGDIKVEVASSGKLLSASYHPHSDTLTVPDDKLASVAAQAGVLHEGIHALVDMHKCKEVTVLNDEAAAYLAEVIYLRAAHSWVNGGAAEMAIYNAADQLAKAHGLYSKRGVRLSVDDAADLRAAIHKHPAYSSIGAHQMTSGHGLHAH